MRTSRWLGMSVTKTVTASGFGSRGGGAVGGPETGSAPDPQLAKRARYTLERARRLSEERILVRTGARSYPSRPSLDVLIAERTATSVPGQTTTPARTWAIPCRPP